jgi:tetratricopeptide (TPR) repeat protein
MRRLAVAILALTVAPYVGALQGEHSHPAPEKLGTVTFPTTCAPEVQRSFERAVALLHSFAYRASEAAFRKVADSDPKCAMAHWGIAMTFYYQQWEPPLAPSSLERGQAEMRTAQDIKPGSAREQGFIDALSAFYQGGERTPYRTRALAYQQAMAQVASRNPGDAESQIFYALALLATALPTDTTHQNQKQAAAILEPLFQRYPSHPGVAHYLIHAYDNPELAAKGLPAARKYSLIAPSSPHALHMPSHIFTRLGMWQDSIASNISAREAAHKAGDSGEELHAMDYLTYAYLQTGQYAEASQVLEDLPRMPALSAGEFKVGYAATAMPVRYAMERKQWEEAAAVQPAAGSPPEVSAIAVWARAVGWARLGKPSEALPEIANLTQAKNELGAAGKTYWAEQVDIQIKTAKAWVALAESRNEEAVALMRIAADQEDGIEKLPLTPGAIVPAREQLGDLLLQLNQPAAAIPEFEKSLALTPGRRGSVLGGLHAAELARNQEKVQLFRVQLASLTNPRQP